MSREVAEAIVKKCGTRKEALKEMARQLITIGAEMVVGKELPSTDLDDMPFLDTATKTARREVLRMNQRVNNQARKWAIATRQAADIAMVLASKEEDK